jgi:hypothetical protein
MRRVSLKAVIYTLVVTFATPAAAFAGSSDDRGKSPAPDAAPVVLPSVVMSVAKDSQPTSLGTRRGWQEEISRATASVVKQTGRVGTTKHVTRGVRKQGGTGQMVTMLVSTVVGLAATVYMLRYMKEQQQNADEPASSIRR